MGGGPTSGRRGGQHIRFMTRVQPEPERRIDDVLGARPPHRNLHRPLTLPLGDAAIGGVQCGGDPRVRERVENGNPGRLSRPGSFRSRVDKGPPLDTYPRPTWRPMVGRSLWSPSRGGRPVSRHPQRPHGPPCTRSTLDSLEPPGDEHRTWWRSAPPSGDGRTSDQSGRGPGAAGVAMQLAAGLCWRWSEGHFVALGVFTARRAASTCRSVCVGTGDGP